jgi:hypothetical protein
MKEMYGAPVPDLSTWGKLYVTELIAPEFCPTAGRPREHKITSKSDAPRLCALCGKLSHTGATCRSKSMHYIYQRNKSQAMIYARGCVADNCVSK